MRKWTNQLMFVFVAFVLFSAYAMHQVDLSRKRGQISEAVLACAGLKEPISEFAAKNGRLPASMAALGLPPIQSKFVQSLDLLADATIVATIRGVEDAEGQIILVRPILEDGKITWTCGAPDENLWKYLPPMCRHKMEPNKQ